MGLPSPKPPTCPQHINTRAWWEWGAGDAILRAIPHTTPIQPAGRPAAPAQDDSLDLGAAVIPVLLKGYWKQGLGGLLVLLVAWRMLRRR